MKPNAKVREVESSGVQASSTFGISLKDSAHIMTILRDTLYSDKELAVLREYSSNAWDAHRDHGKGDVPIKITMPTTLDPTLTIRDFGPGLSPDEVFTIYTQYGASTKRGSDLSVGMLGIGSKSGFAYSDSFTVTSWHGGKMSTYVAVLDASEEGIINKLHEEDCDPSETGISIQIPIKPADIWSFLDKGRKLFRHFHPRPDINLDLPPIHPGTLRLTHGLIYEIDRHSSSEDWIAVMGCVPYRINLDQLRSSQGSDVGEYLHKLSGELHFNIGDIQISASREELKYSDKTKNALVKKFDDLISEFVTYTIDNLTSQNVSGWEKRLQAQVLNRLSVPIPKDFRKMTESTVEVAYKGGTAPSKFILNRWSNAIRNVSVYRDVRFLMKDDERKVEGFQLNGYNDYLVVPISGATLDEAEAELRALMPQLHMDGIPIGKLSDVPWVSPTARKRGFQPHNKKHTSKSFRLLPDKLNRSTKSAAWEIERRRPTPDDVFAIIQGFKTDGYDLYALYTQDALLLKMLSRRKMPPIYGYKSTSKRPLSPEKLIGTHYKDWHKALPEKLLNPRVLKLLNIWEWATEISDMGSYNRRYNPPEKMVESLNNLLGESHMISQYVAMQVKCFKKSENYSTELDKALSSLSQRIRTKDNPTEKTKARRAIYGKYPLLYAADGRLSCLTGEHKEKWAEYITIIDMTFKSAPLAEDDDIEGEDLNE